MRCFSFPVTIEGEAHDRTMFLSNICGRSIASRAAGSLLGCSTSLSCISKGFGGFYSRLWRLRTGKLSSALRLHGFAHVFGHPSGDILDANRAQRLGHEVLGEFTAHALD